ncbi:unnamed protein product, partial [marine sediment metagenome]
PENCEVRIDTTNMTPDDAVRQIILVLQQKGFI